MKKQKYTIKSRKKEKNKRLQKNSMIILKKEMIMVTKKNMCNLQIKEEIEEEMVALDIKINHIISIPIISKVDLKEEEMEDSIMKEETISIEREEGEIGSRNMITIINKTLKKLQNKSKLKKNKMKSNKSEKLKNLE